MQTLSGPADTSSPDDFVGLRTDIVDAALPVGVWLAGFGAVAAVLHLSRTSRVLAEWGVPALLLAALAAATSTRSLAPGAARAMSRTLVGVCAAYIALQRPDFPVLHPGPWTSAFALDAVWVSAVLVTLAAWWRPALLFVTGSYLAWIKALAGHLTGFPYERLLDIQPLFQMALGIGAGILVHAAFSRRRAARNAGPRRRPPSLDVFVFLIVSFNCASYFFSGLAKASLDGGPFSWLLANRLENIYYAGVINLHLVWQDIPGSVPLVGALLEHADRAMAATVFFSQLLAFSLFASRRWAIALLLVYDAMHVGIFLTQGANFFTWAFVNLAAVAAIARLPDRYFGWRPMLASVVAMAFCLFVYGKFYRVAQLGWYDTLALNTAHFEAIDADGGRLRVPNAMFGFYSYPIAHMSFGFPEGGAYFPTSTNGGSDRRDVAELARTCSFAADQLGAPNEGRWNGTGLATFVAALHADMAAREPGPLSWSTNFYWHHFWNPPSVFEAFRDLRIDDIQGYELVVESVCIAPGDNGPVARTLSTTRYALPLDPAEPPGPARTEPGDIAAEGPGVGVRDTPAG